MYTYWITSSKGGIGKTLFALNYILAILDRKTKNKRINILALDMNSVNTDFYDILNTLSPSVPLGSRPPITIDSSNGKRTFYLYPVTSFDETVADAGFKLVLCKEKIKFNFFNSATAYVQDINKIINSDITKKMFDGEIDYVVIDTNVHIGNLLQDKMYGKSGAAKYENCLKILASLNSRFIFFWTWSVLLDGEENEFLVQLSRKENFNSEHIIHVINMFAFVGNIGSSHSVNKQWEKILMKYSPKEAATIEYIFENLCKGYINYLESIKGSELKSPPANFKHLTELANSFISELKFDKKIPNNIVIIPKFYFPLKDYNERIKRGDLKTMRRVREWFEENKILAQIEKHPELVK